MVLSYQQLLAFSAISSSIETRAQSEIGDEYLEIIRGIIAASDPLGKSMTDRGSPRIETTSTQSYSRSINLEPDSFDLTRDEIFNYFKPSFFISSSHRRRERRLWRSHSRYTLESADDIQKLIVSLDIGEHSREHSRETLNSDDESEQWEKDDSRMADRLDPENIQTYVASIVNAMAISSTPFNIGNGLKIVLSILRLCLLENKAELAFSPHNTASIAHLALTSKNSDPLLALHAEALLLLRYPELSTAKVDNSCIEDIFIVSSLASVSSLIARSGTLNSALIKELYATVAHYMEAGIQHIDLAFLSRIADTVAIMIEGKYQSLRSEDILPFIKMFIRNIQSATIWEMSSFLNLLLVCNELTFGPSFKRAQETTMEYFKLDLVDKKGRNLFHLAVERRWPRLIRFIGSTNLSINDPDTNGIRPLHIIFQQSFWSDKSFTAQRPTLRELPRFRAHSNLQDSLGSSVLHKATVSELLRLGADPNLQDSLGRAALHEASKHGYGVEHLHVLVNAGSDVKIQDKNGRTALHEVARNGHGFERLRVLINAGSNVTIQDKDGRTALHEAAKNGCEVDCLQVLVDAGSQVTIQDNDGRTALLEAAKHKYGFECLQVLINAGSDVMIQDNDGRTVLLEVAKHGYGVESLQALINAGVDITIQDRNGRTALHEVATRGYDVERLQILIDAGVDITIQDKNGRTVLYEVATHGYSVRSLQTFIDAGMDITIHDKNGRTTLHEVVTRGYDVERLQILIDAGVDITIQDKNGRTALHEVATHGYDVKRLQILIDTGVDITIQDKNGRTALHEVATHGYGVESLQALIDVSVNITIQDKNGRTALHEAAMRHNVKHLQALIDAGVDITIQDKNGRTALHEVATHGYDVESLQILIDAGVDITIQDKNGRTALHEVATHGYKVERLQALIDAGMDITIQDKNGRTALHEVATHGYRVERLQILIDASVDITIQDKNGRTALHEAAMRHDVKRLQALIDAGVDITIQDKNGRTALHEAAIEGGVDHLQVLIKAGADVTIQDKNGRTALHEAAMKHDVKRLQALIDAGVDITIQDKNGRTALHEAAIEGGVDHLQVLIKAGADVMIQDKNGRTALHEAAKKGFANSIKLLTSMMANANIQDVSGRTPLHEAIQNCTLSPKQLMADLIILQNKTIDVKFHLVSATPSICLIAQNLISAGANVNLCDAKLQSPLHEASKGYSPIIAKYLVSMGAKVNAKNHEGRTALHEAVARGAALVLKQLMENEVDIMARDEVDIMARDLVGETVLDLAATRGNHMIWNLIQQAGINQITEEATRNGHFIAASEKIGMVLRYAVLEYYTSKIYPTSDPRLVFHPQLRLFSSELDQNSPLQAEINRLRTEIERLSGGESGWAITYSNVGVFENSTLPAVVIIHPSPEMIYESLRLASCKFDYVLESGEATRSKLEDDNFSCIMAPPISNLPTVEDFMKDPERRFKFLSDIQDRVVKSCSLGFLFSVNEQSQSSNKQAITGYQTTLQEQVANLRELLETNLTAITGLIQALNIVSNAGLMGSAYSVICQDSQRNRVARVIPISIEMVKSLSQFLDSALDILAFFCSNPEVEPDWMEIFEAVVPLKNSSTVLAKYMGFIDWTISQGINTYAACVSSLDAFTALHTVLRLGITTYVWSHLNGFEGRQFQLPHDELKIPAEDSTVIFRKQRLDCLNTFASGPVWIFGQVERQANEYDSGDFLYLSTTVADFVDLWGPARLDFSDEISGEVYEIRVLGGAIRKISHDPKKHPALEDEVFCHWSSITDSDYFQYSEIEPFNHAQKLLIGATSRPNRSPDFKINPNCDCDTEMELVDQRVELGTDTGKWKKDSRSITVNIAKFVGLGISGTQKFHPGSRLKDVILEQWVVEPEKNSWYEPEPVYLDYIAGIQYSGCLTYARRVKLWDLLRSMDVVNYAKNNHSNGKAFAKLASKSETFLQLWQESSNEEREQLKMVICSIFLKLKNTGYNGKGELVAWEVATTTMGLRLQPTWAEMVKDSARCCSFVLLSRCCLKCNGSCRCSDEEMPNAKENSLSTVLRTRIMVSHEAGFSQSTSHSASLRPEASLMIDNRAAASRERGLRQIENQLKSLSQPPRISRPPRDRRHESVGFNGTDKDRKSSVSRAIQSKRWVLKNGHGALQMDPQSKPILFGDTHEASPILSSWTKHDLWDDYEKLDSHLEKKFEKTVLKVLEKLDPDKVNEYKRVENSPVFGFTELMRDDLCRGNQEAHVHVCVK